MWGPLVWLMYFLSAFYFVILEPRLQVFKISAVKWVYNLTIIAFNCYLFMQNLPAYVPDMPTWDIRGLAVLVIAISVYSSADMHFMKWLAILSTWGVGLLALASLAAVAFFYSEVGMGALAMNVGRLGGYFANLHSLTTPITDYYEFYRFWWFA